MKKIITTIMCLAALVSLASAQTCDQFISNGNGKKVVYSNLINRGA